MAGIKIIYAQDIEILLVDYSNLKEDGMINLLHEVKLILDNRALPIRVLSVFNEKNFATPNYMRQLEKNLSLLEPKIIKNAVIGLSQVQIWIVAGINLWYKSKIHAFESEAQAIEFLVNN